MSAAYTNLEQQRLEKLQNDDTWDDFDEDDDPSLLQAAQQQIFARFHRDAEIQDWISAALPALPSHAVGRNDPCPCGSGRKFKKCCGK